jgi:hypothetical protein
MGFKAEVNTFWSFIHGLFREPDGTPSMTRTLMIIFSFFDVWVIWRVIYHCIHLTDNAVLGTWLSNLPMLIGALIALASMPYAINRGTTSLSDIGNMFAQMKSGAVNAGNSAVGQKVDQVIINQDSDNTKAAAPATGSAGDKG